MQVKYKLNFPFIEVKDIYSRDVRNLTLTDITEMKRSNVYEIEAKDR